MHDCHKKYSISVQMLYWQDAHERRNFMSQKQVRIEFRTTIERRNKMDERIKKLKLDRTAYLEQLIDNDLQDSGNIIPMKMLAINLGAVSENLDTLFKDIKAIEDENYDYLKNKVTEVERGMITLWQSLN